MSEDAQEACNKIFQIHRINFERKYYSQKTMEEVFKRFLITPDPQLSRGRKLHLKPLKSLSKNCIKLLTPPYVQNQEEEQKYFDSSSASEIVTYRCRGLWLLRDWQRKLLFAI